MRKLPLLLPLLALAAASPAQLRFEFDFDANVSQKWRDTLQRAGAVWSSHIANPATVRIKVGEAQYAPRALGNVFTSVTSATYANFRSALAANPQKSALDVLALTRLEPGKTFRALRNDGQVRRNPNGSVVRDAYGYAIPIRGADGRPILEPAHELLGTRMRLTNANAKALGLPTSYNEFFAGDYDGVLGFTNDPSIVWDFDPSDGIGGPGREEVDALGLALAFIGRTMGFFSDMEFADNPYYYGVSDAVWNLTRGAMPLDLFRYQSDGGAWRRSFLLGADAQYFSVDGATMRGRFSTGANLGNGFSPSYWYENVAYPGDPLATDLMRPRTGINRLLSITANDLAAFDAIGWNLRP